MTKFRMKSTLTQAKLVLHNDLRLLFRDFRSGKLHFFSNIGVIVAVMVLFHAIAALGFWNLHTSPPLAIETGLWTFFGFMMLGASMNQAISLFFERSDFDLLLASPISARAVLLARLAAMSGGAFLSAAWLLWPLIDGIGFFYSLYYLSGYLVWFLLALGAASVGVALTLLMVKWLGPRRARTWVQVMAAVLGASVYLCFQLRNYLSTEELQRFTAVVSVILHSPISRIARAGRGELVSLFWLIAITTLLVAVSAQLLARTFLTGMQESEIKASPSRRSGYKPKRSARFAENLLVAGFRKDLRLISRDPLLLSQILPSMAYIIPAFIGLRRFGGSTVLAPICVVLATQFSSLLADVAVSGEEGLDLIRMSPSPEVRLRLSKLAAGMAWPLAGCALLSIVIAFMGHPGLALVTFVMSAITAAGASWLSVTQVQPTPRKDIIRRRRRGTSILRNIAIGALMITACVGISLFAQDAWWIVGTVLLGVTCLAVIACFTLVSVSEIDYEARSS